MYSVDDQNVTFFCDRDHCNYRQTIPLSPATMPPTSAVLLNYALTIGWDMQQRGKLTDMVCPLCCNKRFENDIARLSRRKEGSSMAKPKKPMPKPKPC